eukprot:546555-Pelagomonas_calceolata.AAC.3
MLKTSIVCASGTPRTQERAAGKGSHDGSLVEGAPGCHHANSSHHIKARLLTLSCLAAAALHMPQNFLHPNKLCICLRTSSTHTSVHVSAV